MWFSGQNIFYSKIYNYHKRWKVTHIIGVLYLNVHIKVNTVSHLVSLFIFCVSLHLKCLQLTEGCSIFSPLKWFFPPITGLRIEVLFHFTNSNAPWGKFGIWDIQRNWLWNVQSAGWDHLHYCIQSITYFTD